MGLDEPDVALVERLVRHHLTLAELATRRDHADPATLAALVDAVDGRLETLNLLRLLTEADSRAAGPAAWSPWRAQLINALADRAESQLIGEDRESDRDRTGRPGPGPVRAAGRQAAGAVTSPRPAACRWSSPPATGSGCSARPPGLLAGPRRSRSARPWCTPSTESP